MDCDCFERPTSGPPLPKSGGVMSAEDFAGWTNDIEQYCVARRRSGLFVLTQSVTQSRHPDARSDSASDRSHEGRSHDTIDDAECSHIHQALLPRSQVSKHNTKTPAGWAEFPGPNCRLLVLATSLLTPDQSSTNSLDNVVRTIKWGLHDAVNTGAPLASAQACVLLLHAGSIYSGPATSTTVANPTYHCDSLLPLLTKMFPGLRHIAFPCGPYGHVRLPVSADVLRSSIQQWGQLESLDLRALSPSPCLLMTVAQQPADIAQQQNQQQQYNSLSDKEQRPKRLPFDRSHSHDSDDGARKDSHLVQAPFPLHRTLQALAFCICQENAQKILNGVSQLPRLRSLVLHSPYHPPPACPLGDGDEIASPCSHIGRVIALTSLPAVIGNMRCLVKLDMRGCSHLRGLPSSLLRLEHTLKDLRIHSQELLDQAGLSSLSSLQSLRELDLCLYGRNPGSSPPQLTARPPLLPDDLANLSSLTRLDLSHCYSLQSLPSNLGNISHLQNLKLRKCSGLKTLPASLTQLHYLVTLDLSHCVNLKTLPVGTGQCLKSLKMLDLTHCSSMVALPSNVWSLPKLEELHLVGCRRLQKLPAAPASVTLPLRRLFIRDCADLAQLTLSMATLTSLEELWLTHLPRVDVATELATAVEATTADLTSLSCLRLQSSTDSRVPECVFNLRHLHKLYISQPCLSLLPSSEPLWSGLQALQVLELADCRALLALPSSLCHLPNLHTLNLTGCCGMTRLPDNIGYLSSLRCLILKQCKSLEYLPEPVGDLTTLNEIDLTHCLSLSTLPRSFGQLAALKTLHLDQCSSLSSLPDTLHGLESLTRLSLRGDRSLARLPDTIAGMRRLRDLNLADCAQLEALPDSLGSLASLRVLVLDGCKSLEGLPRSIGYLTALQFLSLRKCDHFQYLPFNILGLGNLRVLNLDHCLRLQRIPAQIIHLPSLQQLSLCYCGSLQAVNASDEPKLHNSSGHLSEHSLSDSTSVVHRQSTLLRIDLRGCFSVQTSHASSSAAQLWRLFPNDTVSLVADV